MAPSRKENHVCDSMEVFPVRECTDYNDRRVPGAPVEANATGRRFGFVTTLSLQDKDENSWPAESAKPVQ